MFIKSFHKDENGRAANAVFLSLAVTYLGPLDSIGVGNNH